MVLPSLHLCRILQWIVFTRQKIRLYDFGAAEHYFYGRLFLYFVFDIIHCIKSGNHAMILNFYIENYDLYTYVWMPKYKISYGRQVPFDGHWHHCFLKSPHGILNLYSRLWFPNKLAIDVPNGQIDVEWIPPLQLLLRSKNLVRYLFLDSSLSMRFIIYIYIHQVVFQTLPFNLLLVVGNPRPGGTRIRRI